MAAPRLFPDPQAGPEQCALAFGHEAALGRQDFLVSRANREAMTWVDRWPDWPGCCLALAGPAGSGKSHLARIWIEKSGATILQPHDLNAAELERRTLGDVSLVLERGRAVAGDGAAEEALFHLYNAMRTAGRSLLIVDRQPPARWSVELPDLASRLATVPVASIEPPDDALLETLFFKLFADRQLQVPPEIVAYLLPRMSRSFASVQDLAARLDAKAFERKSAVTLAVARAVLAELD